jgi:hypothetical protein
VTLLLITLAEIVSCVPAVWHATSALIFGHFCLSHFSLVTLAGIVSCFTALWHVFSFLVVEAWPERFIPGKKDLLPRFSNHLSSGQNQMFKRGFMYPHDEPGVIKGQ